MLDTWRKLVSALTDSETATINWLISTLRNMSDMGKISSFRLPRTGTIMLVYKNFYREAYMLGGQSVFDAVDGAVILFTGRTNTEIQTRARLSGNRLITKIEEDLKWEWERYLTRRVDRPMLIYRTKYVFAKAGGWDPPNGPNS